MIKYSHLVLLILLFALNASAVKLDIHVHDDLINRLNAVLSSAPSKKSRTAIQIRLADLYSDRARLKAIALEEGTCSECKDLKNDRVAALSLYDKAFYNADKDQQVKIILQKAHLYAVNSQLKKSERVFKAIIKNQKKYPRTLVGEAYAGLGELYYRQAKFSTALKHFKIAAKMPIREKVLVGYRTAWCQFHEGNTETAKKSLFSLLNQEGVKNSSFGRDIVRDLTTFIGRGKITHAVVNKLMSVTPKEDRRANLFLLGQEADRLGNKQGALLVWGLYRKDKDTEPKNSAEALIRTAQTHFDLRQNKRALVVYSDFYKALDDLACSRNRCKDLKDRGRKFAYTWIKRDKSKPTQNLQNALDIYLANNDEDLEMLQWSAHTARARGKYQLASQKYGQTAELAKDQKNNKILEGSLLAEIETAENSGQPKAKEKAYLHYISLNPKGKSSADIRYQLAYSRYEQKRYDDAFEGFDELVRGKYKAKGKLRIQSADLALDCLALMGDKDDLQETAEKYAKILPKNKMQYLGIARKAAVNSAIANKKSLKKALRKLKSAPLAGASKEEKINIYKNQVLIAEQLQDIDTVNYAANKLLQLRLSYSDREFALSRKLWVATKKKHYKTAYRLARQMKFPHISLAERELKMGILAELAKKPAHHHYRRFIKETPSLRKANTARIKLIREVRRPWKELKKHEHRLKRTPGLYGEAVIEAFAKRENYKELRRVMKNRKLRWTAQGQILQRFINIQDTMPFSQKIRRHKLNTKSDRQLQRSIGERRKLLAEAEKRARKAIQKGVFSQQVLELSILARENSRIKSNILRLRTPRGLNRAERKQYKNLLKQRTEVFRLAEVKYNKEIEKLYSDSKDYDRMQDLSKDGTYAQRVLIARELKYLTPHTPRRYLSGLKRTIKRALSKGRESDELKDAFLAQVDKGGRP